jgi:hypothetical protein
MLKKLLAGVATLSLALGMVAATAGTASAHTQLVTSTCSALTVNLTKYPAIVTAVTGVTGVIGHAEQDATYVQTWQYEKIKDSGDHVYKWKSYDWNHGADPADQGWTRTGVHKNTADVLTPKIEYQAAVTAVTPVEGKVNTVKVVIDGVTKEDTTFGNSFNESYPFTDSSIAHTYKVTVVSSDGKGNYDETHKSDPCVVLPTPGDPASTFTPYEAHQDWYAPLPATVADHFAVPQTTKVLVCDGIKQSDYYWIKTAAMQADYTKLISGGILSSPAGDAEFSPHNYTITALPACVVPPLTCVVNGKSDTEQGDLSPVLTEAGLVFDGPTEPGQGKDIYYRVTSGNAQGITGIGYTVAPGSVGFTAQINIEVNPHNAIGSYTTLAANESGSGTFSNMETQPIWWATRIHSGPGSLSQTLTLTQLIALMPNNTLYSAPSLHLQSNSLSTAHSVVTSMTSSCHSYNYVTTKPEPTTRQTVVTGNPVCTVDDSGLYPGGGKITTVTTNYKTPFVWDAMTAAYVTGVEVMDGTPKSSTSDATLVQCPVSVITIQKNPQSNIIATCGAATAHMSNAFQAADYTVGSEWTATIFVDGVLKDTVKVPGNTMAQKAYTFAEDTGDHKIVVMDGNTVIMSQVVHSDCVIETVTPVLPVLTQPTCTTEGSNALPEQPAGVMVNFNDAGTGGTFTPKAGYKFTGESQSISFDLTLTPANCVITTVPKVEFSDACGITGDTFTFTPSGENFTATKTDSRVNGVGTVKVVYTMEKGYSFPEGTLLSFSHDFTNAECDLPVLGLSVPSVTSTPITCSANGSYTVGGVINAEHVVWTLEGDSTVIPFGTYPVSTSQTIRLVASSDSPGEHGLADLNSNEWINPTVLTFTKPGGCGQLKTLALPGDPASTLAFTGGTGSPLGLALAGALLFLGGVGVYLRRRFGAAAK